MSIRTTPALVLIDWDTATRFDWVARDLDRTRLRARASPREQLGELVSIAARALSSGRTDRFLCSVRLYHGWHRGTTATDDHRRVAHDLDRMGSLEHGRCLFESFCCANIMLFGDDLDTERDRDVARLFDTVRARDTDGTNEQKMVDTALASDLLHWARRQKSSLGASAIILGADDDLYPPVALARHWGIRATIVRSRGPSPHMAWMARYLQKPV